MKLTTVSFAAIAVLATSTVHAADLGDITALASNSSPVSSWDGFYVGAGVAGAMSKFNMDDKDCWYCASGTFTTGGLEFGGEAGFNIQSGSMVYGLAASASTGSSVSTDVWWDDGHYEDSLNSLLAVRAKGGVAIDDSLLYASIGVLAGNFSGRLDYEYNNQGINPTDSAVAEGMRMGVAIGAGWSKKLDEKLSINVSAEYQLFETVYAPMCPTIEEPCDIGEIGFGTERVVVQSGLAYHF